MRGVVRLFLGIAIVVVLASGAFAASMSGRALVIDGDSIEIQGTRIRILDIDAPESAQLCFRHAESIDQGAWRCGRQAATSLSDWIGQQSVTCDATTQGPRKGWLSRCTVAGQDIAEWLAANGWAVPHPSCKCEAVRAAADRAKAAQVGIWSGGFTPPWEWREAR
jgi:endonuclease YncB( thermonuclease family)